MSESRRDDAQCRVLRFRRLLQNRNGGRRASASLRTRASAAKSAVGVVFAALALASPWEEAVAERGLAARAAPAVEPPQIDGVLSEAAWDAATPITDFFELEPAVGGTPSEATEVRILYDADNLYIGAELYDREPERIVRNVMVRQARLFGEDRLHIVLDTFDDHRNGYYFEVNANGMRADALIENNTTLLDSWDGIWSAAATVHERGWTVEVCIPFKSLSFAAGNETWGLNLYRSIAARAEYLSWNTDAAVDFPYAPALAGRLTGLHGLRQGLGLDVVPSFSLDAREGESRGDDTQRKPSLDVLYKITDATTAALTLNTDFSATEADDRQVNLTRFALFFPEKRLFFLQDAGIFEFGGLAQNGRPFFSRTIGLSEAGDPLDLDGGLKITGREGRTSFGALAVRQSSGFGLPAQDLFVGRGVVNVLEQSSVGVIATQGDPHGGDNAVYGADFRYRSTRFAGDQVLEGTAWAQRSRTGGADAVDDEAFGGSFRLPNDRWYVETFASSIGRDFDPAMGFVNRPGVRDVNGFFRFRTRPQHSTWLMHNNYWLYLDRTTDLDGRLQSSVVEVMPWGPVTLGNDFYRPLWQHFREVVDEPFLLFDHVPVAAGDYDYDYWSFRLESAEARALRATVTVGAGGFYDGERRSVTLDSTWRAARRMTVDADLEWDDVRLPSGRFIARLLRGRVAYALNARTAWIALAQYDDVSRELGVDLRLQWLPRAGQEVHFILRKGAVRDLDDRFEAEPLHATVQAFYTWRW